MQLSLHFVAGLLLASNFVVATNTSVSLERRNLLVTSDGELDLPAFNQHFKAMDNKYQDGLNNFQKNTGKSHPLAARGASKRAGSGDVDLKDVKNGKLWAGEVTYGGQSFSINFDTGSADTLVNPEAYKPSKSKASKNTGKDFSVRYGDGTTAKGKIYTDSFSIAGLKADKVAIGRSTTTFIKDEESNQGVAGMGFSSIQTFPKEFPPFFESLRKQKALDKGIFQFTLKRGSGSTLHLGSVDSSKFKGDVSYAKVDPLYGWWVTSAKVNNQKVTAIIDSGSTLISGPPDQVKKALSTVNGLEPISQSGQTRYQFDCSKSPSVTIEIAGKTVKLSDDQTHWSKHDGKCVLPIVGQSGIPLNGWILGDPLFRATSIIFDVDQNRIGFALQA